MRMIRNIMLSAAALVLAAGCASVQYTARSGYVGFNEDGAVTVQQMKKTQLNEDELYSTYDDEFVYDEDGNVIKHIQTEYFNKGEKYDEWVVEYQIIGGNVLPRSMAVNGVVYMEVEYEILESDHEGPVYATTGTPQFTQGGNSGFSSLFTGGSAIVDWNLDLENFEVPFRTDGRFVTREGKFGIYTGLSMDKVLSLGYDNIVLKRFYYSSDKYYRGYNLSVADNSGNQKEIEDKNNVAFEYDWKVIGGKIAQTGMTVTSNSGDKYMKFFADRQFDDAGRRTHETWKINDSKEYSETPLLLFQQDLTY